MNAQNAAQYLPLVKALAEGKTIQIELNDAIWTDNPSPDWSLPSKHYRIKPERKTITGFVNVYPGVGFPVYHDTKENAESSALNKRIACVPVTITYEEGEGL